jgi:DNA polymerase III delta prime subunit
MTKKLLASTAGVFRAAHAVNGLNDLVWPTQGSKQLIEDYVDGFIDGHLLLHGPFGTGKTEMAKRVPFALTGDQQIEADTLFINASDITTKSELLPKIHNFSQTLSFCEAGVRFVILDEADRLDPRAQDALKGIIDRYGHVVRFIFTTNHFDKLDGGIKSRCHCMEIGECSPRQWLPRARAIMAAEHIDISDDDLLALIDMGNGSGRKIMQMLERFVARHRRQAA